MKKTYIAPKLKIVCFMPLEGIALENIDLDLELVNLNTYSLSRGAEAGDPTTTEDDDMFLPIGPNN